MQRVVIGDDLPAPFTHDGNPVVPVYTPAAPVPGYVPSAQGTAPSPPSSGGYTPGYYGSSSAGYVPSVERSDDEDDDDEKDPAKRKHNRRT